MRPPTGGQTSPARIDWLVVLGFLILLGCVNPASSSGKHTQQTSELPELVAILSAEEAKNVVNVCSRSRPEGMSGFFAPSEEEVLEAEGRLIDYLEDAAPPAIAKRADLYHRQYVGLLFEGRRKLYVNAFLDPFGRARRWRTQFVKICGGGEDAWGLVYDIEKRAFSSLEVNADL